MVARRGYVLDWHVVPNTWLVKIGTNLSRHEVLALEDVGFQLQQREVLPPRRRLSTIATLPSPWTIFCAPLNPDAQPTSRYKKVGRCNLVALMASHKCKWECAELMDNYYVVGVIAIPYPRFEVLIYIVSNEDIAYHVTIGDILLCTCPNFTKISSRLLGRKGK